MSKFLTDLKTFFLDTEKSEGVSMHPHYEAIKQNIEKLSEIIEVYETEDCYFYYHRDESDGYTDGSISLYYSDNYANSTNRFSYAISLSSNAMRGSYCECKPEDEGYNPVHDCCGYGCDYYFPSFHITKSANVANGTYYGAARDLWESEKDWKQDMGISHEEQHKEEIEYIERQIQELLKRKEEMIHSN